MSCLVNWKVLSVLLFVKHLILYQKLMMLWIKLFRLVQKNLLAGIIFISNEYISEYNTTLFLNLYLCFFDKGVMEYWRIQLNFTLISLWQKWNQKWFRDKVLLLHYKTKSENESIPWMFILISVVNSLLKKLYLKPELKDVKKHKKMIWFNRIS